jgi:hypothetical protein
VRSWTSLLIGLLGLAVLDGIVSGPGAGNVGGFLSGAGAVVRRFLDPTVPLFSPATPVTSSTSSGTAAATTTAQTTAGATGVTVIPPATAPPALTPAGSILT